jgi:hypothetical protein
MTAQIPNLLTIGEIARRLDQPIHRVEYVLRSRNVAPAGLAGNARVFAESDVAFLAAELRRIDDERSGEGTR